MIEDYVYHASQIQGLEQIVPSRSTHGQKWVYATRSIVLSSLFIGDHSDFHVAIRVVNNKPQVIGRIPSIIEKIYACSGSIYKLHACNFLTGQTSWNQELVSSKTEEVLDEIRIENNYTNLLSFERKNRLKIFRYPQLPSGFPQDKSDLIVKGTKWTIFHGERVLDKIEQLHPDILPVILNNLKTQNYQFKSEKWLKKVLPY